MTIGSHLKEFHGKTVSEYKHGTPFDVHKAAPRIFVEPYNDDKKWEAALDEYLMVQDSAATTHLVSGMAVEAYDRPNSNEVLGALVKNKTKLPNLEALFIGDITFDECELSWIGEGDLTPVWEHFPNLKAFAARGYPGEMGQINMPHLESFTIQCSGLNKKNAQQIQAANMPNLTHLEIWIGTEEYGGATNAADWAPLLSGNLFPKLKYLGLRNCDFADDLAKVVANSPILDRLDTLDMSFGTMGDEGALALYQSDKVRKLKHLDLHYHWMSNWMMGRFQGVDRKAPEVPKKMPKANPYAAPAVVSTPQKSGGFFARLFGTSGSVSTPAPAPAPQPYEEPNVPEKQAIDYASVTLIPAGQFGPTVNLEDQQERVDDEDWRYVAVGE